MKQIYIKIPALTLMLLFSSMVFANDGDLTFSNPQIHTVYITCWKTSFWDTLLMTHTTDSSMPCHVVIDGVSMDTVGIKIKGNSSFNSYPGVKKSFKITFDEYNDTLKFDGLKVINLNNGFKDPTLIREKLFLDFLHQLGLPAPRCVYAKVYINGTYWGLYDLVEQVNKTFLNDVIGNKDGNLFKGDPQGTLQWMGSTASSYYPKYELKTNDSINDWTDLIHLIDVINNTPSVKFHDSLETVLNTAAYLRTWAANNIFVNLDSYVGSGHNYYIYQNTFSHKFEWITWDVNESFGNFNQGMSVTLVEDLSWLYIPNPANSRPLNQKMMGDSVYQHAYMEYLCGLLTDPFTPEKLNPQIDSLANLIRNDYYADPNKMYTNQQFEDNINHEIAVTGPGGNAIPGLKSFIANRRSSLMNQIHCTPENNLDENSTGPSFSIYPDPFRTSAVIEFPGSLPDDHFVLQVYDIHGRMLRSERISSFPYHLERKELSAGIYFFSVVSAKRTINRGKFSIID